jgi:hypothetical protein
MDVFRVSKTINAPIKFVYDWCTDYREDDSQLTGSTRKRIIFEKTKKRAVYAQLYDGRNGKQTVAVDFVTLNPSKKSWHLEFFGEEDYETGDYKLTSLGKSKTKLAMVFREKWKIPNPPSIAEQIRHTDEVWDKYISALEADYAKAT